MKWQNDYLLTTNYQLLCIICTFVPIENEEMKIVADNTVPFLKGLVEDFATVTYLSAEEFTSENVRDADVLVVRSINRCTRAMLEGSKVQLITSATIGFDHIDTDYCDEAGIIWKNAPGCNAVSVGEYILASLFTLALRKGESLEGKTLGVIGVGHVGAAVESLCSVFGMRILRNDPPREKAEGKEGFVSLDTIAEESDIITIHTPLTQEGEYATFHLADTSFFRKLRKKPWYINTSRGAINDTAALLEAKHKGRIGELILDCWENEPGINRELLGLASIATPHIAGFSADGKMNAARACLENIADYFHITIDGKSNLLPPPAEPIIDLNLFPCNERIEQAIFHCFNPLMIDKALREMPERFEWFRANYSHPREFNAYTIKNATSEEAALLQKAGFNISDV